MALYLGSVGKVKINSAGNVYCLQLFSKTPITNGMRLVSSDGYILKDSNGLFVIVKKEDE
jgi:hypothetical protein